MNKASLGSRLRLGFYVFGALMILEVAEYMVGTRMKGGAWPFLAVLAVLAAWPIVRYFMHIKQLWRREE